MSAANRCENTIAGAWSAVSLTDDEYQLRREATAAEQATRFRVECVWSDDSRDVQFFASRGSAVTFTNSLTRLLAITPVVICLLDKCNPVPVFVLPGGVVK